LFCCGPVVGGPFIERLKRGKRKEKKRNEGRKEGRKGGGFLNAFPSV
jgi:hypothetical protein